MAVERVRKDRISNLPRNIIEFIFTLLPLREVVRTSILSTQWRHKWSAIPDLVFDENFTASLPQHLDIESTIYHVLLAHKGPLVKFILNDIRKPIRNPTIDHWLHILSKHPGVETLTLDLRYSFPKIPRYLFQFQHLMHLTLICAVVELPASFQGFDRLVSLNLELVKNVHEVLKSFTSKCPMLEHLYIDNCYDSYLAEPLSLDISAPRLKTFHFYGVFDSICFESASIKDIQVRFYEDPLYDVSCVRKTNMIEFFSQLPSLGRAEIYNSFFMLLDDRDVMQKLPNNLHNLALIKIHGLCGWLKELNAVLCLIRSSPNLQVLEISLEILETLESAAIQFLKLHQGFDDPLGCSLKIVKIEDFKGNGAEMEFVKLLLLGATALEKLEIKSHLGARKFDSGDLDRMVAEVISFPRASPNAVVVFEC